MSSGLIPGAVGQVRGSSEGGNGAVRHGGGNLPDGLRPHVPGREDAGDFCCHVLVGNDFTALIDRNDSLESAGVRQIADEDRASSDLKSRASAASGLFWTPVLPVSLVVLTTRTCTRSCGDRTARDRGYCAHLRSPVRHADDFTVTCDISAAVEKDRRRVRRKDESGSRGSMLGCETVARATRRDWPSARTASHVLQHPRSASQIMSAQVLSGNSS